MTPTELQEFLDFKAEQYENPDFLESDPIQLVHRFTKKEDIEIVGFLVSTIAWGNRKGIIKSGENLLKIMGNNPHEFILKYEAQDLNFVHRTFNNQDLDFFFRALKDIYLTGDLESAFAEHPEISGIKGRIVQFRSRFLTANHELHSEKHISNPLKNSACKRINMFLRWMARPSTAGVDLGIWKTIPTSELCLPLDVHTSNNARRLGLISRKQDDWKALEELMENLRKMDANDPVKYDFALFGLGVFEGFGA